MVQRKTGNAGIADGGWALSMVVAAGWLSLFAWWTERTPGWRAVLVAGLGMLWAGRLAWYIFSDRVIGKPEDRRYARLRASRENPDRFFATWFAAQVPFALIFGLCFWSALQSSGPGWTVGLAVLVFGVAVGGEWLADQQLARFRANPANRGITCREGMWGWSRHPNYFFEWVHWWTYVLLAVGTWPWWLVSLVGPALMFVMLWRVSGIPLTEKLALESRGESYERYQSEVSAFFPLPPRGGGKGG